MNNECVIGIDIGGTNIRIGRTDENDQLVDFERVSSKETFKDGNISESLIEVLKNYLDKYCKNVQVKQIAIGIPATLSSDRKQILQVPNIKGMDGLFLGKELEENLGIPVVLEKDVNMLYYWDKYDKKLSDEGVGIGVYIGTGVGNAIFINGKPLAGKDGVAGELGHIPMIGGTSQCGCGNLGCSECYASGWKLVELKEEYYPDVDMNDLFVKKSNDTVLKNFVDNIACVACTEINILNPDSIIFGGGVINMKGFPKDYLEERLYVHARKPYPAESLEIQYSEDKVDNGVKGAIIFAKTLGKMQGQIAAKYIKKNKEVDKNYDGKIQYVLLEGEAGHQDAISRTDCSVKTIIGKGIKLEKLSYQFADWNRGQAENRTNQLIEQYGDKIEMIISNNDEMALGALEAYKKSKYHKKQWPIIFGIDGLDDALTAIKNGEMQGTVYNDKEDQALEISRLVVDIYQGNSMKNHNLQQGKYYVSQYKKVEKSSIDKFIK